MSSPSGTRKRPATQHLGREGKRPSYPGSSASSSSSSSASASPSTLDARGASTPTTLSATADTTGVARLSEIVSPGVYAASSSTALPTDTSLHLTPSSSRARALPHQAGVTAQSLLKKGNIQPFLAKLYCMVNDHDTDDIIAWSDDGDSFYVFRSDQVAKTVLPKFFKHGNFSSFVRQLNLYGFHKVPQLTQATLASSSAHERWQFANPIFKRDQTDLLVFGERRKTVPIGDGGGASGSGGGGGGSTAGSGASSANGPASGQGADIASVLRELVLVRNHQMELSQEMRSMQAANASLWQEADATRAKSERQQEVLDKILRFLASVFSPDKRKRGVRGAGGGGPGGETGSVTDIQALSARLFNDGEGRRSGLSTRASSPAPNGVPLATSSSSSIPSSSTATATAGSSTAPSTSIPPTQHVGGLGSDLGGKMGRATLMLPDERGIYGGVHGGGRVDGQGFDPSMASFAGLDPAFLSSLGFGDILKQWQDSGIPSSTQAAATTTSSSSAPISASTSVPSKATLTGDRLQELPADPAPAVDMHAMLMDPLLAPNDVPPLPSGSTDPSGIHLMDQLLSSVPSQHDTLSTSAIPPSSAPGPTPGPSSAPAPISGPASGSGPGSGSGPVLPFQGGTLPAYLVPPAAASVTLAPPSPFSPSSKDAARLALLERQNSILEQRIGYCQDRVMDIARGIVPNPSLDGAPSLEGPGGAAPAEGRDVDEDWAKWMNEEELQMLLDHGTEERKV